MLRISLFAILAVVGINVATVESSRADTFGTYGDTTISGNFFDLTSSPSNPNGYSGIYVLTNGELTLSQITQLSADYNMTQGAFQNGAPRFSIGDTTNNSSNELYAYWGIPNSDGTFSNPNSDGTLGNTGNYANLLSSDLRFQINGFGGVNTGYTYLTWAQVVADVGKVPVGFVTVDLDGGYTLQSAQALLVNNFTVNNDVDSPAAATPLPPALPLFASGIGALVLSGWRRKQKPTVANA